MGEAHQDVGEARGDLLVLRVLSSPSLAVGPSVGAVSEGEIRTCFAPPKKPGLKPGFVGIYRGSYIILGFPRRCEMDFATIHGRSSIHPTSAGFLVAGRELARNPREEGVQIQIQTINPNHLRVAWDHPQGRIHLARIGVLFGENSWIALEV